MSHLMQRSNIQLRVHTNSTIYKNNAHYGLLGLRERYFARERGHEHRPGISVNNSNINLQYLYVLNPKDLHLRYTSAGNGLDETACDRSGLSLNVAQSPRRPAANQATGGTPREIKLHREFSQITEGCRFNSKDLLLAI